MDNAQLPLTGLGLQTDTESWIEAEDLGASHASVPSVADVVEAIPNRPALLQHDQAPSEDFYSSFLKDCFPKLASRPTSAIDESQNSRAESPPLNIFEQCLSPVPDPLPGSQFLSLDSQPDSPNSPPRSPCSPPRSPCSPPRSPCSPNRSPSPLSRSPTPPARSPTPPPLPSSPSPSTGSFSQTAKRSSLPPRSPSPPPGKRFYKYFLL